MNHSKIKISLMFLITLFSTFMQLSYATTINQSNDSAIQNAILVHINEYRQKRGLSILRMNEQMVIEAKKHSQDMATHNIPFGHQKFMARINRLHKEIKNSGAGAENVAYNYRDAGDVVRNWLKSPGHKHNIDGNYDITGIGIARDNKGKLYFTQIFLKIGTANHNHEKRKTASHLFVSPFFSRHS